LRPFTSRIYAALKKSRSSSDARLSRFLNATTGAMLPQRKEKKKYGLQVPHRGSPPRSSATSTAFLSFDAKAISRRLSFTPGLRDPRGTRARARALRQRKISEMRSVGLKMHDK